MKNIIFDIGNVLLSFQPEEYLNQFYDENTKNDLMAIIFSSDEWVDLDFGKLTINQAIQNLTSRYPHYTQAITFVLNNWTNMLLPIKENIQLAYQLKEKGYALYLLSNFHKEAFLEMNEYYDFFQIFDGGIISGFEHVVKPEKEIYQLLIDRYHINVQESLFIDDMLSNIHTAIDLGMQGIHLHYLANLEEELKKRNLL